jgi:hypothetical protein
MYQPTRHERRFSHKIGGTPNLADIGQARYPSRQDTTPQ